MEAISKDIRATIKAHEDLNSDNVTTHPAMVAMFAKHNTTVDAFRKEVARLAQARYDALPQTEKDALNEIAKKEWKALRKELKAIEASRAEKAAFKRDTLNPLRYMSQDIGDQLYGKDDDPALS